MAHYLRYYFQDADNPVLQPAPARRLVCTCCPVKTGFPKGRFCWNNAQRFGGLVYGRAHQALQRHDTRGGYDPRSGTLTAFKNISEDFDDSMMNEMLDSLTAAVEAGLGTPATFFADFFATPQDVQNFADALEDYSAEGTFWVNDQHFNAFVHATHASEENAVTYSAMADHLRALDSAQREKAQKAAKSAFRKNAN